MESNLSLICNTSKCESSDSEEEIVFVGPITEKEKKRLAKVQRLLERNRRKTFVVPLGSSLNENELLSQTNPNDEEMNSSEEFSDVSDPEIQVNLPAIQVIPLLAEEITDNCQNVSSSNLDTPPIEDQKESFTSITKPSENLKVYSSVKEEMNPEEKLCFLEEKEERMNNIKIVSQLAEEERKRRMKLCSSQDSIDERKANIEKASFLIEEEQCRRIQEMKDLEEEARFSREQVLKRVNESVEEERTRRISEQQESDRNNSSFEIQLRNTNIKYVIALQNEVQQRYIMECKFNLVIEQLNQRFSKEKAKLLKDQVQKALMEEECQILIQETMLRRLNQTIAKNLVNEEIEIHRNSILKANVLKELLRNFSKKETDLANNQVREESYKTKLESAAVVFQNVSFINYFAFISSNSSLLN